MEEAAELDLQAWVWASYQGEYVIATKWYKDKAQVVTRVFLHVFALSWVHVFLVSDFMASRSPSLHITKKFGTQLAISLPAQGSRDFALENLSQPLYTSEAEPTPQESVLFA